LPATAGAATLYNEGIPAEEGSTVTLKSHNTVIVWGSFGGPITAKCQRFEFHGIVTVNAGGKVLLEEAEEASAAEGCTANGSPFVLSLKLGAINLSGSTGTVSFSFTALGVSESSTSAVSWVGPDATSAHVSGSVVGSLPGTFSGDFTFEAGEFEPLTLT
jgi:hypothetical protein